MQNTALQISAILEYAANAHGSREIISFPPDGRRFSYDYSGLCARARRAASLFARHGIRSGDRLSSLAWNNHRHLELFYAVPGIGAVLHTANPRLSDDQLVYTINHAESRILLFDLDFLETVERIAPRLATIERFIILAADDASVAPDDIAIGYYDDMVDAVDPIDQWPLFDESAGAFLCYTSGTTGDPKGVVYSHRSVVLHALAAGLNGALGLTAFDCIMPCQSLYHATAWGLPFVAPINGCKLVLPGSDFSGAALQRHIREESVTFSGGVPTIWTMYLDHLARSGEGTGALDRLMIGGSAVPRAMAETFETRYGVTVRQIWGMTETSPLGVLATPTPQLAEKGPAAVSETIWTKQGRLQFGIDVRIVDDAMNVVPADGVSSGRLMVRGPWVTERYYRSEYSALDADGWFDTGDLATLDVDGFVRITDRVKDVIKSGGEWISSIDLENAASELAGVRIAAVVGVHHPKWEERPILVLEVDDEASVGERQVIDFLAEQFPRWWLPEAVIFAPVPLTSTGKIEKKELRARYANHLAHAN